MSGAPFWWSWPSLGYERWLDHHGWSWRDVLQRVPGQILGELLAWVV